MRRIERIAAARAAAARVRLAAALDAVPGIEARATEEGVALEGRDLRRRMLEAPDLRDLKGLTA